MCVVIIISLPFTLSLICFNYIVKMGVNSQQNDEFDPFDQQQQPMHQFYHSPNNSPSPTSHQNQPSSFNNPNTGGGGLPTTSFGMKDGINQYFFDF